MNANRGTDVPDYDADAPDLASEVARLIASGRVRACYVAGERYRELYGATRTLMIGVTNSDLRHRDSAERDEALARIAEVGAAWLRRRGLLAPGTRISIRLSREVDLVLVSWSWGTGGRNFWIGADGRPTVEPPVASEGEDA